MSRVLDAVRVCALGQVLLLARACLTMKSCRETASGGTQAQAIAWWVHTLILGILLGEFLELGTWLSGIGPALAVLVALLWLLRIPMTCWILGSPDREWRQAHRNMEALASLVFVAFAFGMLP